MLQMAKLRIVTKQQVGKCPIAKHAHPYGQNHVGERNTLKIHP